MRITMRFISVLAAVLLFTLPVMGISAQGGAVVPSPVIVETGTGGEIQALTEGLLYKGSGYVPGVVASEPPGTLPVTGGGWELQRMVEGLLYKGSGYVPGTVALATPEALPPTGTDRTGLTEFEWQWRLNEMIAGGMSANGGQPAALPETGSEGAAELGFIGVIGRDGMPAAGINEASYLWGANAALGRTASGSPKALPLTGASPSEPPYYEALPVFLASANSGEKTGQDTQKILDGIAGGVRNITEILPEELAAVGR